MGDRVLREREAIARDLLSSFLARASLFAPSLFA